MDVKKHFDKSKKKESSKSIKKYIIAVFLIAFAFVGSFAIYFILQVSLQTQAPLVVVVSGSMRPYINEGDLLFLRGTDPEDIQSGTIEDMNGDVIVYDARGLWNNAPYEPIVHRVVDKWYDDEDGMWYFQTKGDSNSYIDRAPVPEDHILGVVIGKIPWIGWIKIFLTDSGLMIPLIIILSALLIISIVWDVIIDKGDSKEDKKEKRKIEQFQKKTTDEDEKLGKVEIIDYKED